MGGLALLILGVCNWSIGLRRTQLYSQMITAASHATAATDYRSFDELEPNAPLAVIGPLTAQERQLSYATARTDYYHATYLAGQALVTIGLLLTLWGFIAVIRRDSRRMMWRMGETLTISSVARHIDKD